MRAAWVLACLGALLVDGSTKAVDAADVLTKAPLPVAPSEYDWTGSYVGGHLGYAWGSSNWTTTLGVAGSLDLFQGFDVFKGTGSYFGGLQAGYDYMLPNRFIIGVEADASFPSFQNPSGISIGGISTSSSLVGAESYSETVLSSGTLRGRIG